MNSLFEQATGHTVPAIDAPPARKNRGWLPLLTILFLISYGLMTMLIVEQGTTIESQRLLIHELFRDSTELSAAKVKAQQEKAADARNAKTQGTQSASEQAPSKQNPSSQAAPQRHMQAQPKQFQLPSKPAADLADERRSVRTI